MFSSGPFSGGAANGSGATGTPPKLGLNRVGSVHSIFIIFNLLKKPYTRLNIVQYKFEQDNQAHGALIVAQKSRPSKHLSSNNKNAAIILSLTPYISFSNIARLQL